MKSDAWHVPGGGGAAPPDPRLRRPANADLCRWFHENRVGAGFDYPSEQLFVEQSLLNDPSTRVAEAPGGIWGILASDGSGGGVQAVVAEELMPDPVAVAAALRVWRLPSFTTDPVVGAKVPSTPSFVYGMAVPDAEPPPWPLRWALQAMDRA